LDSTRADDWLAAKADATVEAKKLARRVATAIPSTAARDGGGRLTTPLRGVADRISLSS
jgi:hypothetical protein